MMALEMRMLEIVLPLCFIVLHGLLYNAVGSGVTDARGIDFGPVVMTWLDARIPFLPPMVFPYMLAWFYPLFLVVALVKKRGVGILEIRRIFAAILLLELLCYCLWVAFPVKVGLRVDETALAAHGWLGSLVLLNYEHATVWHACPSFHVAGPWFFYRTAQLYGVRFIRAFLVMFVAIAVSTVTIRIHYLMDIVVGLAVSELVFRTVLCRFEERKMFASLPSRAVVGAYLLLLVLATAAAGILSHGP